MRSIIYNIIAFGLMTSCVTIEKTDLSGTYYQGNNFEINFLMNIDTSGEFVYNWQIGLVLGETKGTWKRDGRYIKFESHEKPDTTLFNLTIDNLPYKDNTDKSNMTLIYVLEAIDSIYPMYYSIVYGFNAGDTIFTKTTDENGEVYLENTTNLDSLKISYLGFNEAIIPFSESLSGKKLSVTLKQSVIMQEYHFLNETWKIKGNKLYRPGDKRWKDIDRYYKKAAHNSTYAR